MQMLPAILPNAPSAAAHLGKASEPTTEGVFQNVLNQESGKAGTTEPKLLAKQSEAKTAKNKATNSSLSDEQQPDATSEAIVNQEAQAILAVAQNLIPESSIQGQPQDKQTGSEQAVAPATEALQEQTTLRKFKGLSHTENPSEKTTAILTGKQPAAEIHTIRTAANNAGLHQTADIQGVQSSANNAGPQLAMDNAEIQMDGKPAQNQPVAKAPQSGKRATEGTGTPLPQVAVESQSTETLKTVASQTNKEVELPLAAVQQPATTPASFGINVAAGKPVATEPTAQVANNILRQQEQTSTSVSEIAVSVEEQTKTSAQQITPAQTVLASVVPNGQPAPSNTARKIKTETLGDSRFTQLLGRQDPAMTGILAADNAPTASADLENPGLVLHNIAGLNAAVQTTAATGSQPAAENAFHPEFATGENPIKGTAIQSEKVMSPAPTTEALTGQQANSTQPAELETQPVSSKIDNLASGNNETAPGLTEGSVQHPLAGSASAPVFSPAQAPAAHATTLQQNTGFPIPEQEVMAQVIQRSSLRELEGKRELTVELNPKDLGQVKLNLVQEKDQLQLHLQAQSNEVRDILEKHLPRLQEALQQQGLRLETIQVSVDAQRNNTQGFFERQQQQQAQRNPWQHANRSSLRSEEPVLPVQAAMTSSAKGLSLRI